jgi:hypothetical protein
MFNMANSWRFANIRKKKVFSKSLTAFWKYFVKTQCRKLLHWWQKENWSQYCKNGLILNTSLWHATNATTNLKQTYHWSTNLDLQYTVKYVRDFKHHWKIYPRSTVFLSPVFLYPKQHSFQIISINVVHIYFKKMQ